jgi:hypothetical protein
MRVEAFVPDWPGEKQNASEIANKVARLYPTRILDNPEDYFNAQWARAREEFTGDVLLWVMADVTLPGNWMEMFREMERLMETGKIGWCAPNVDWTGFIFDKNTLTSFEKDIYEVPNTDSLCFAVRGDVVRAMPHIDPELCFMWGLDFTAIVTAHLMGLKIVRDYRFKVLHPNNTGYGIEEASVGMRRLFEGDSFEPHFKVEMQKWIERTNQLKRRP